MAPVKDIVSRMLGPVADEIGGTLADWVRVFRLKGGHRAGRGDENGQTPHVTRRRDARRHRCLMAARPGSRLSLPVGLAVQYEPPKKVNLSHLCQINRRTSPSRAIPPF